MNRALRFLRERWMWWLPPLIVAALLALTLLWLYPGDGSSPFLYPSN
jgi:hypothetical protein